MRQKAIIVTLLMVGSALVPLATASHMSVGNNDAVAVPSEEGPGDPTVEDDRYQDGIKSPDKCDFDPSEDGIEDPDDAQRTLDSDAFCSHLNYNHDTPFPRTSPEDQDYKPDTETHIGSWDVVYGAYVGNYGLSTCVPWCTPGGESLYDGIHDTGNELGLTDDSQTVRENERYGWQEYAVNVVYPSAFQVIQQETGAWEMNGFIYSQPDQQWIGFLEDPDNNPITGDDLEGIHEKAVAAGDVSEDTAAQVCGFTPDDDITISAPQATFCEVLFSYSSEDNPANQDPGEVLRSDDYNDPCESPTYVCGGVQEAWHAYLVCAAISGPRSCGTTVNSYEAWHWVVAPAASDCSTDVEPGFVTSSSHTTDRKAPYLAHDLDVYSPLATAADEKAAPNLEAAIGNTIDGVNENISDELDDLSDNIPETPPVTDPVPREISKVDRFEPNAPGDTSQTFDVERNSQSDCEILRGGQEAVFDNWKNYIDNEVTYDTTGEPVGWEGGEDLYLNDRTNQDASNRPGYGQYFTDGFVGMFADKDDDGDYSRAGAGDKFSAINQLGAYPMIWDIQINKTAVQDQGAEKLEAMQGGCQPGFSDVQLTNMAKDAGYGPNTGLMQVIYLEEPSYLFHWGTGEAFPQTQGSTAYVFVSDNYRDFLSTDLDDSIVDSLLDDAVGHIPGVNSASDVNVVFPHELTSESVRDFDAQCSESTGGFTSSWGFAHTCAGEPGGDFCAGDTVITKYNLDLEQDILGGDEIPALSVEGEDVNFGPAPSTWTDVDPLDGDADRNDNTCDRPVHHEDPEDQVRGDTIDEDDRYPCGHDH